MRKWIIVILSAAAGMLVFAIYTHEAPKDSSLEIVGGTLAFASTAVLVVGIVGLFDKLFEVD